MPRVWRRYGLTPQRRQSTAGANYAAAALVSLPAPLRYQPRGPREQLAEGGINRPGYRTHQSRSLGFIGFQARRFGGDISGVCRLPVRELPGGKCSALRGDCAVSNPRRYGGPAASLWEYPPAHTKVRRQYSSSQCQMMAPVLMRDPSSFALLERILTSTLHTAVAHMLYFHLSRSLIAAISSSAAMLLTNRQQRRVAPRWYYHVTPGRRRYRSLGA